MRDNKQWHYDTLTRVLHWSIALLLVGLISLGFYMVLMEGTPETRWYFNLHKSLGLIAAILIFFRLIWRLMHTPAPLPLSIPRWQARLSRLIHVLLYVCMILMPISGFMGASFGKYGILFFGIQLPTWVNQRQDLSEQFFEVHEWVAWILVGLIVFHFFAAMKHLLINKDKVFQRMWF